MTDPLQQLEAWAEPLLQALDGAAQRKLARTIAQDLRRSQAARIAAQINPDGSAYAPRKPQQQDQRRQKIKDRAGNKPGRVKPGRIKAMFAKLRTPAHLRTVSDDQGPAVGFLGRVARIARVHQHGLQDKPSPNARTVTYPVRELLGFTPAEVQKIRERVLEALQSL